ncbi:MAG: hypothetical protein HYV27_07020 [Candidatus Hydrogenedentes bacterium]|nr:hypothetical protein [Candidatus Hydrogenedentota bacterium]
MSKHLTLLNGFTTRCKNTCRAGEGESVARFEQLAERTPFRAHVFEPPGLKT